MAFQATARLRYVSIPPRKMRLVADLVKGMPIEKALDVLNFTPKIAARHMAKTLKSAAANALSLEGTDNLRPEDLVVKNIIVDSAPTQKRVRFQSMGRVYRYKKRFSHLTVILEEQAPVMAAMAPRATKAVESEAADEEMPAKARKKTPDKKKTPAKKKAAAKKKTSTTKKKTPAKKTAKKKTASKARPDKADKPTKSKAASGAKSKTKKVTKKTAKAKDSSPKDGK